jgi:glycosyltransferase involved in cell wall biosynthesis
MGTNCDGNMYNSFKFSKTMKIAFFGFKNSFDYFHIGGAESFTRRISYYLIEKGYKIDYLLYGYEENNETNPLPGLTLKYFKSFENALNLIKNEEYDHIITMYLLPKHRINYAFFRKRNSKSTKFHFIYFNWADLMVKRYLYFNEARLLPYNGKLFCISKRQYEYISKWAKNAVYLLPPVPENYFLNPNEKPINEKIKIIFLGRIDPGKGINEVIEIFNALKSNNKFECSIYGIHNPEHKEALKIHNWLKKHKEIKYIEVERQKYSPEIEEMIRNVLKNTDILILPYKRLSSTIDTPLTLLEAMASLCVVITKPFGNIPDIYGKSKFLISPENFVQDAIKLLNNISQENLVEERYRIYEQNKKLNFSTSSIGEKFINAISR